MNRAERGERMPGTFTFRGRQPVYGKDRLGGFEVRSTTWRMDEPIAQVGELLRGVLRGYYQYQAVPGNL